VRKAERSRNGSRAASRAAEDYLKAIFRLEEDGSAVSTSDLADSLGRAAPSVTNMIKGLAAKGLVDHVPYHGVRLTREGRSAALRILRRHRVLESYLIEQLGYGWDGVHSEAERLEHAASDELIDRMARAIGEPDEDPHGSPIPASDGHVDARRAIPLAEAPRGETFIVGEVQDRVAGRLREAGDAGLFPGVHVQVRGPGRDEGSLEVLVDGTPTTVTRSVAAAVSVREA